MPRIRTALVTLIALVLNSAFAATAYADDSPASQVFPHSNWRLESSCKLTAKPEAISLPGFDDSKWHPALVPGTVVGSLVADKTLPDPNYGKNLNSFPGAFTNNKIQAANLDMRAGSPFRCSHWFRTEFTTPAAFANSTIWLHFLGINYRANIWLNGKQLADRNEVAGAYRAYEFSIGDFLHREGKNALAVEIFAPEKNDLGLTWVDWNPTPPDKDTGMWREVFLTSSGDVTLRHPFANAKLDSAYKSAALTLSAELRNTTDHAVKVAFVADVADIHLTQPVELAAKETKIIRFAPDQFPQLKFSSAHLWWPYQMGEPFLYKAEFSVKVGDTTSDSADVNFGIREVTSELTESGGRLFKVNGKRVLIRGAAWAPDMLLRWDSKKLDADLAYVKDMGLNTIRLEGKVDRDEFFDETDRLGILVMPGWICCDAWEHWNKWTPETKKIAAASMVDQASRLRNHPSVFVWLYGSDGPPPADIENMYLDILKNLEWPNPTVSSASETPTKVTGKSGVKMTGPYEYVPPMYWLSDKKAGGAWSYNTETSPGPAIPTKESLAKFIPKEHLWPIDDYWNFHAGGERFTTIDVFRDALEKRYGAPTSLDDFERKAQAMTYDNQRSMFEAYARNKYVSTGVIQWMLNNAWPSLIWHLYDYYLVPAGGYFGTKKATEILHVQYDWDTNSVSVVNGMYTDMNGLKVIARLYNIDGKEVASRDATINVPADSSVKALDLPTPQNLSTTYFLKLQLTDSLGRKDLSNNFYWLSTKLDTMDWKHKKDTVYTPQKDFADLTGLNSLPQVKLDVAPGFVQASQATISEVRIKNPSNSIAFMIHVRLFQRENGDDVTPVFWSDNYFSLLPGEEKNISGHFNVDSARGNQVGVQIDGYNITPQTF